jgi:hypothetical protein
MKRIVLLVALCGICGAQQLNWKATTGDVSLSSSATTATIQQPAASSGGSQILIDQIVIYCSAACSVSQAANGTAATATAGTVNPVLPTLLGTPIPITFWTASNVGTGTDQGGIIHVPIGSTVVLCLSPSCGNPHQVVVGPGGGTASNYSVSIASTTATVNITFFGRTQ